MRCLFVVLAALMMWGASLPVPVFAQEEPSEATPVSISRTDMRYISPYTPDGLNPALTAESTGSGVCGYPSSHAIDRPDAWDCISDNDVVYDPCFENPFADPDMPGEVACFESPFSTDVTVLALTEPLVRNKTSGAEPGADAEIAPWDLPWAMELANGEQCSLLGGTLTVFAGQVVHYGCSGGGGILGETDRSRPVWVVSYIADGAYETTLVEVATAWS